MSPEEKAAKKRADNAARQARFRQRKAEAYERLLARKGLPPLPPIPNMPGDARWKGLLTHAHDTLETMLGEMVSYYEDRSEEWQESEKGEEFQERIDNIQELIESFPNPYL